ncbi:MAG: ribulose-phosphate 3-epimerase [Thermoleophilia bacterium]
MPWQEWVGDKTVVEPSIYAADLSRLGDQVEALLDAGARIFHVDIGDGRFIEEITIGPIVVRSLAPLVHGRGGVLDCHLMVAEPGRQLAKVKEAGGDSVTFHVEAVEDVQVTVASARALGLGVGLALNPSTPVEAALAAADAVDLVLCMSVHPGLSGQAFMPEALPRVAQLRRLLPQEVLVQVDGGISLENARAVREAGARLLVAGSAVFWQEDPVASYQALVAEAEAGVP